jgi:hypothetical protein
MKFHALLLVPFFAVAPHLAATSISVNTYIPGVSTPDCTATSTGSAISCASNTLLGSWSFASAMGGGGATSAYLTLALAGGRADAGGNSQFHDIITAPADGTITVDYFFNDNMSFGTFGFDVNQAGKLFTYSASGGARTYLLTLSSPVLSGQALDIAGSLSAFIDFGDGGTLNFQIQDVSFQAPEPVLWPVALLSLVALFVVKWSGWAQIRNG